MNLDQQILTFILLAPLVGAAVLAFIPEREGSKVHHFGALIVTLITFGLTLHLSYHFAESMRGAICAGNKFGLQPFAFQTFHPWIALRPTENKFLLFPGINYHVGVDGLSMWLVVLTGALAPLGVLASWNAIKTRTKTFFVLFLLQQVAMIGIFVSLDLFLYYGFWELSLVPMTILIATFGRTENRRRAAIKYFLYAFIPSAILLVGIIWLYVQTGTFDITILQGLAAAHKIPGSSHAIWLCSLAFLLAFAVKVPIFPLHGWLADGIAEAPTALVMVLAGKLGLYSILRFSFGIFPEQSRHIAPLLIALGAIGIVYGALNALVQDDLKKLAAFSTLSHVSFITLGIFTFTVSGIDGGAFQILNESLIGAALFILLGLLYERYGTYDMRDYGGLAGRHPWMITFFVITSLAAVGLPMMNGFVGEFLILSGTMQSIIAHHIAWTVVGTTGVIFSSAYMLWMIQRVFYGKVGMRPEEVSGWDLCHREHLELWPLAILFLVMGLAPSIWMKSIDIYGAATADKPGNFEHIETEAYSERTLDWCFGHPDQCHISNVTVEKEAK